MAGRSSDSFLLADDCRAIARHATTAHLIEPDTSNRLAGSASPATQRRHAGCRMLTIDGRMPARLARLRTAAEPFASGYSLHWLGATPAKHLDQVAAVRGAMADAPRDVGMEPSAWTADRVRQSEQVMVEHRLTLYSVAARYDATGDLVALTQVCTESGTPDWAFQEVTAVRPKHRGHRLGWLVKLAMLDLLAEHQPAVRHIQTGNAGENAHMIAINEQLGFTIAGGQPRLGARPGRLRRLTERDPTTG